LKELHPIEIALLRERIEKICDMTLADLQDKEEREKYNSPVISASQWESTMKRIKSIVTTEKTEG
jgi:hypothetical protein